VCEDRRSRALTNNQNKTALNGADESIQTEVARRGGACFNPAPARLAMIAIFEKLTSGQTPTGAMAVAGILLLLLAWKAFRGVLKLFCGILAFGFFAAAVVWYMKHH